MIHDRQVCTMNSPLQVSNLQLVLTSLFSFVRLPLIRDPLMSYDLGFCGDLQLDKSKIHWFYLLLLDQSHSLSWSVVYCKDIVYNTQHIFRMLKAVSFDSNLFATIDTCTYLIFEVSNTGIQIFLLSLEVYSTSCFPLCLH